MVSKEMSKVTTNAIHSVERIGKYIWFYHYARGAQNTEIIRAQLPFCILPLNGIQRIDINKNFEQYNTYFHYINDDKAIVQRIDWCFSDQYSAGGGWYHSEWCKETEAQIQKVLEIVGNTDELK